MPRKLISYNPKTQTIEEVKALRGIKRYMRHAQIVEAEPTGDPEIFLVTSEKYNEEYLVSREILERDYVQI